VQGVGPLAGGGGGPSREGVAGGGHGGVDVVGAGQCVAQHLVAGGRVDDGVRTARRAVGETAGDVLRTVREPVPCGESFRGALTRVVHVALLRRRGSSSI
jgi:hypothetical protein